MSEVNELEKLAALKEKGILSEDEFNAKKAEILNTGSSKQKKSRGLLWKIPLALIGLAGLLNAFGIGGDSKLKCDASNAKTTLKGAFDQSQFARTLNLSAIDINDITEKNRDDKAGTLSCRATITMNTTKKVPVSYKIEQHNDGKFLLTFEVLDEAENTTPMVAPPPAQASPPTNISALVGKAPESALDDPALKESFKILLGDKLGDFRERLNVSSGITQEGEWLVGEGGISHLFSIEEAAFAINSKTSKIFAIILTEGKDLRWFGTTEVTNLPAPLQAWYKAHGGN